MPKEILTNISPEKLLPPDWTVHPKRQLEVPNIEFDSLLETHPALAGRVETWIDFLAGRAVSDNIGTDHDLRRSRRGQLFRDHSQEYGLDVAKAMREIYDDNNQLRVNLLGAIKAQTITFERYLRNLGLTDLADRVLQLFKGMDVRLNGGHDPNNPADIFIDYEELSDVRKKIGIVHYFEDSVIELLNLVNQITTFR